MVVRVISLKRWFGRFSTSFLLHNSYTFILYYIILYYIILYIYIITSAFPYWSVFHCGQSKFSCHIAVKPCIEICFAYVVVGNSTKIGMWLHSLLCHLEICHKRKIAALSEQQTQVERTWPSSQPGSMLSWMSSIPSRPSTPKSHPHEHKCLLSESEEFKFILIQV